MKRFLSMLTVIVLSFSLVVPASAVSSSGTSIDVDGKVIPLPAGQELSYIASVINAGGGYKILMTGIDDGWTFVVSSVPLDFVITESTTRTGQLVNNHHFDVDAIVCYYSGKYDSWREPVNYTLAEGEFINLGIASFLKIDEEEFLSTFLYCDGSSCPATDVNIDGICDDCGMTLMSLSRSPVAPDVTGSNKNYVMFYSGTVYQYTAYTSDSSYTIRGGEYGARYRTYLEPSATATRFQSYDGINWEQTYNGITANDYPGEIGWELISSTYDWYTEEGDRFFPVPLWEEVQTVTQGEMGILTSEMAGTMRTLVVCGVGLMACLMALSLFGKRWLLFLR